MWREFKLDKGSSLKRTAANYVYQVEQGCLIVERPQGGRQYLISGDWLQFSEDATVFCSMPVKVKCKKLQDLTNEEKQLLTGSTAHQELRRRQLLELAHMPLELRLCQLLLTHSTSQLDTCYLTQNDVLDILGCKATSYNKEKKRLVGLRLVKPAYGKIRIKRQTLQQHYEALLVRGEVVAI